MIYAGQERGNETYRGPIRWHDGDNDLTDFHRDLAALREREPLLREGGVDFDPADVTVVDGDPERMTAFARTPEASGDGGEGGPDEADGDALLVVVNFASEPATVAVPDRVETDLFADRAVGAEADVEAVAVFK
jgi:cyclomaltodextrinase